ncbi:MAG: hypothetical protein EPO10_03080 [Reyranella sp.]|uniref:zinc-binding dehydrogenase n=1 Tax=Reyranella sp. TaxID=1929291 RepID=UPI0012112C03|nr:zinc-binding dehydrogenase [Reyranella sp.]TAJ92795.1 MAG: hypothetical protein EPO41_12820 [Reyranella sp.]TBR30392.1 MAG: hypothetical protein EPO10_03080 [Reyranella sp.]
MSPLPHCVAERTFKSTANVRWAGDDPPAPAANRVGDLAEMAVLAETGALKPGIDRRYRFAQMVEAHAYVETGRKRGSIVGSVERPS